MIPIYLVRLALLVTDGETMNHNLFIDFPKLETISIGLDPSLKEYFKIYYEESKFGLKLIIDDLSDPPQISILEIGSGIGLLSCYLASKGFKITALEPAAQGFGMMSNLQGHVRKYFGLTNSELKLLSSTLEEFTTNEKYNYIFSINVFEHLDNPEQGLKKTNLLLTEGGVARIITPNYRVPYEPHFHIPIFITKKFTYAVYRSRILTFECFDPIGLWESLNWISIPKIQRMLVQESIPHHFDIKATHLYYDRFEGEDQFLKRKGPHFKFVAKNLKYLLKFLPTTLYPVLDLRIMRSREQNNRNGEDNA
jgi:SAM-dependent methyltransferase